MIVREGVVTFRGKPVVLVGEGEALLGSEAPDFTVSRSVDEDVTLSQFRGQVVVINVVPSLDTPVCDKQTTRFNNEASEFGDKAILLTVSMDLPFAQARWCASRDAKNLIAVSDYKHREFGRKYSLLMRGLGLLARSVYVVDADGVLRHAEVVPQMEDEPDYDLALKVTHSLI